MNAAPDQLTFSRDEVESMRPIADWIIQNTSDRPPAVLWLSVFGDDAETRWERALVAAHLPGKGDGVQLWPDGPYLPTQDRAWLADGTVLVLLLGLATGSARPSAGADWDMWNPDDGDLAELLAANGWTRKDVDADR